MKTNTIKLIILLGVVWIWLPTGASDLFIIPFIIDKIGLTAYIGISILLVIYLYKTIDGRTLNDKINNVKKEVMRFIG